MAGIWISSASGGIACKQPDYRIGRAQLEAECNKEDPAGQRDHGLRGEPVFMINESPFVISSSLKVSFGVIMAKHRNR